MPKSDKQLLAEVLASGRRPFQQPPLRPTADAAPFTVEISRNPRSTLSSRSSRTIGKSSPKEERLGNTMAQAKTPKVPFQNLHKPSDEQVFAATKGTPFKPCPNCGRSKISSEKYCVECSRLVTEGFGVTPRAPHPTVRDTAPVQSYPSDKNSGYHDTISTRKIDPTRERF
jgi:hypothetical protein